MAAKNYFIVLNDDNADQSQYTGTLYDGGSYTPGTSKLVVGGSGTGLGLGEVAQQLLQRARNLNAQLYDVDDNN